MIIAREFSFSHLTMLLAFVVFVSNTGCRRDNKNNENPGLYSSRYHRPKATDIELSPNSTLGKSQKPTPSLKAKRTTESILDLVNKNPESIRLELERMGPGEARRNYLKGVFLKLTAYPDSDPSTAAKFLAIVDKSTYPEDSGSLMTGVWELTRRIGTEESLKLINELDSSHLKILIASGLGKSLAITGELPTPAQLSRFDETARKALLVSLGSDIEFASLEDFSNFVIKYGNAESPYHSMVLSSLNEPKPFGHMEIINRSFSLSNPTAAGQLFEFGISRFIKDDPLNASRYLIENKGEISSHSYQLGAKRLADYLEAVGDEDSARAWRKESITEHE